MAVIEVENLVKEYKISKKDKGIGGAVKNLFIKKKEILRAVDNISFKIEPGEIVGYIGPNGAGKSTTVKMLSGILQPTSGSIMINGLSPQTHRKQVVKDLGVVFGQRSQLYWDLRLGESFELLKYIYKIDDSVYIENLKAMDNILGINKLIDTPVRQLSLGQRMRGDLVASMLHSPSVLFLDEPTIGLDVEAKYVIRKFIKDMNKIKNTTVILTTHDMEDIQELCSRIIIINNGTIIEDGSLKELIDRLAPYRYLIVDFYKEENIPHPKAEMIEVSGTRIKYRFEKSNIMVAKLIEDISASALIKDISIEEAHIDDIIREVYRTDSMN